MPHIVVKMYSGRTDEQKLQIADAITQAIMASAGSGESAISVAIEDVDPAAWVEAVYKPEILGKSGTLFKKPGYDPL